MNSKCSNKHSSFLHLRNQRSSNETIKQKIENTPKEGYFSTQHQGKSVKAKVIAITEIHIKKVHQDHQM